VIKQADTDDNIGSDVLNSVHSVNNYVYSSL